MSRGSCGWLALAVAFLGLPARCAEPPPGVAAAERPAPLEADKKAAPPVAPAQPPKKLDLLKLPADAVIIVCDEAKDALRLAPQAVRMTPEKYQELLDQIAALKAKLDADRPIPPSKCQLKGHVEDNFVKLQAQFEFATATPNAVVLLACSPAQPTAAQLDGKVPVFRPDVGSLAVQVEKPGDHQLTLELTLGLLTRGGGRGFELELPRAVITTLDLSLPAEAKEVRVGGKALADTLLTLKNGRLAGGLGAADKLDVKWRKGGAAPNAPAVLTSAARVQVQLDERETTTRAELTLRAEGAPAAQWRLLVPLNAKIKLASDDESRLLRIDQANDKYASLRTILLKEPAAELGVTVTATGPPPRAGQFTPVGPFALKDATRQTGVLLVATTVPDLRLLFHPRGDLEPRELSDEDKKRDPPPVASFRYGAVALPDKPQATTGPNSLSFLDVEAESTRGLVETRVSHQLLLQRDDTRGRVWRVRTTVEATPYRTGVDHLDVLLPPDCVYDKDVGPATKPPGLVRSAEADAATRLVHFKLANDPLKPFQLTLEAVYQQPVGETGRTTLALPRPQDTHERGGQVTVVVPDSVELLPEPGGTALEAVTQEPQQQVWRAPARVPERVEAAWQPYHPKIQALAVIDLDLTPREGRVRHALRFQFPRPLPPQVALRVPDEVAERVKIVRGGAFLQTSPRTRVVRLAAPSGKEPGHELILEYSFPLPEDGHAGGTFKVPLVVPEPDVPDQIVGETKVRVWSDLGLPPVLASAPWGEIDLEAVADRPRLPVLAAAVQRVDEPLSLKLGEASATAPTAVLADRVLVRVLVGEGGVQSYRVRFLLARLAARRLEVELPAPVPSLNLRVSLDGKEVNPETVDDAGQRTEGGRVARLRLAPNLVRKASVLEVSYELPAVRTGSGLLQTTLQPPLLRGEAGRPPTRWYVSFPDGPSLVVLGPEGGPGSEPGWGLRGWLPGPRLTLTGADLERWFNAGQDAAPHDDGDAAVPNFTCWRNGVEPLTLTHAPQRGWLLACSLATLVPGLGLFLLARRHARDQTSAAGWFWALLALLPPAAMAGTFFWPTLTTAVLYGCEPGALVLVLAVAVQLALHERYRRQIVFLPNFRRGGSSLIRPAAAPRVAGSSGRHGEPSTVDAPQPPNGSWPPAEAPRLEGSSKGKREGGA